MELIDKKMFAEYFQSVWEDRINRIIIIAGTVFAVGFFAYWGYHLHIRTRQEKAQYAFSESLEVYKQAVAQEFSGASDKSNMWDEVEMAFKTAYKQNQSSTYAPYFLAYQAEALIRQGKKQEAKELLEKAVSSMNKNQYLKSLYNTKLALLNADQEGGIQDLINLAQDAKNPFQDMAKFYLGEYYYAQGDLEKAKEQFVELDNMGEKSEVQSPWVRLGLNYLNSLN